jgi:DNA-binding transcriptional MerR regulator/methylmalonyl-CoA mutase cobalamin-binding subunit
MKAKNLYPIRYVALQTGLSTHLIRVWEKRHQAVVPHRTDTNRRVFSREEIKRLQMLKKAVRAGHSISQIASLTTEELRQLVGFDATNGANDSSASEQVSMEADYFFKTSLTTVLDFDAAGLESVLDRAAVHLTKLELIDAVIVPLCKKIGVLWKQGELKIINEHMATTVIQSFLWNLLRSAQVSQTSPKIVITTPAGQQHELGALSVALIACESDWRPLYFGPSLPAEEIAAAAAYAGARAVALSITYLRDDHQLILEVKQLRRYLTGDITIMLGGQGVSPLGDLLGALEIKILKDIDSFRTALDTLAAVRHH